MNINLHRKKLKKHKNKVPIKRSKEYRKKKEVKSFSLVRLFNENIEKLSENK